MIIVPANTLAAGGFEVANSCRFNDGDSAYMHQTPSGNGSNTVFTLSLWFKRGQLGTGQSLFAAGTSGVTTLDILSGDTLAFYDGGSTTVFITNRVFRDVSAWYHIALICNTGESGTDKCKLYINGTLETSFSTDNRSTMDAVNHVNQTVQQSIGQSGTGSQYIDGYLAEIVMLDGTATAIGNLGEYDEDSPTIWKPKNVSGLSFGTNGYYLDFEDSSNLGNNAGSGSADFTEVNLAAADQATDTPTNNFCTMNPLDNFYAAGTFSEGNCHVATSAGNTTWGTSTFGLSKGCWYYEVKFPSGSIGGGETMGIIDRPTASTSASPYNGSSAKNAIWRSGGDLYINDSNNTDFTPSGGDLWVADNIMGVYIDLDNSKIYCSINGVMKNSGTGVSITAISSTKNGVYFLTFGDSNSASTTFQFNFGGCSTFAISSAASDANGYGNFEYSPTVTADGSTKSFYAICTKNLAEYG